MTEAQTKLVEENLPLVRFTIKKHFQGAMRSDRNTGLLDSFDDLEQIGRIGLCKAAANYDEGKGCTFSTYAVICIRGEISRELRAARTSRRDPEKPPCSLDKIYGDDEADLRDLIPDPVTDIVREVEARDAYTKVAKAFEGEPVLLAVATRQMTLDEAAELLNISKSLVRYRVRNIINRYIEKEETHGKDQHVC
jgi:RNA polymerase sigma factor (sigma-70 family)